MDDETLAGVLERRTRKPSELELAAVKEELAVSNPMEFLEHHNKKPTLQTSPFGDLPSEILERVNAHEEVLDVRFFAKEEWNRGMAWDTVRPRKPEVGNPWRRIHTQNYWAWVKVIPVKGDSDG